MSTFMESTCSCQINFIFVSFQTTTLVNVFWDKFNALITKPSISLAPMLSVAVLGRYGYLKGGDVRITSEPVTNPDVADAMFCLAAMTPIIVGIVQLFVWAKYSIRTSHLTIENNVDCSGNRPYDAPLEFV